MFLYQLSEPLIVTPNEIQIVCVSSLCSERLLFNYEEVWLTIHPSLSSLSSDCRGEALWGHKSDAEVAWLRF